MKTEEHSFKTELKVNKVNKGFDGRLDITESIG